MDTEANQGIKKRVVKAVWNKNTTTVYCDICIQAIQKNMRPGTHLSTEGWNFLIQNFAKETGYSYDKVQLKNKWDQLKKDWKIWKELIGKETGLGWDPTKKTIDAPSEWWEEKIRVVAGASKFQKEGLDPDLVARLDIMFGDTVATGEFAWAPSSINIQTSEHIVHPLSDRDNIEQGSNGYSVEDFEESLDVFMQSGNASLDDTILEVEHSNNKRKGNDGCSSKGSKGRKSRNSLGGAAKLRGDISRLVAAVENRTAKMKDAGISLSEIMTDVESLAGVTQESDG